MSKRALSLVLATAFLTACPQPPEDAGAGGVGGPPPQGEGAPPPSGDGAPPPPDGDAGPPAEGTAGPPPDASALAGPQNLPATFAELEEGTETITLSGTITGAPDAQIDLTRIVEGEDGSERPEVVQVIKAEGGTYSIEIPADYESELYVFAFENPEGTGPGPDTKAALHPTPIKASDGDVTIDLTLSADFNPETDIPWFDLDAPEQPPPPEGGPTPPAPGDAPPTPAGQDAAPAEGGDAPAPAEGDAPAE